MQGKIKNDVEHHLYCDVCGYEMEHDKDSCAVMLTLNPPSFEYPMICPNCGQKMKSDKCYPYIESRYVQRN